MIGVKDIVKKMSGVEKGLKDCENKSTFLWKFIEDQIEKQQDINLINLRRLINKTLKDRRVSRRKEDRIKE